MSGSLIKIDEEIVTSAVASVTLGGSNWDSSYDVYQVIISNLTTDTDQKIVQFRYLDTSYNPITTSTYSVAFKVLKANTTFGDGYGGGTVNYITDWRIGTATGEVANCNLYIFNANSTTEYKFNTCEATYRDYLGNLTGQQGGGVMKETQAITGISVIMESSVNITAGKFQLYGLKK